MVGIPLTGFTLPLPGFQTSYVAVPLFVFSVIRREMNVCFIDIGRFVDHHCLNFLLMIIIIKRYQTSEKRMEAIFCLVFNTNVDINFKFGGNEINHYRSYTSRHLFVVLLSLLNRTSDFWHTSSFLNFFLA